MQNEHPIDGVYRQRKNFTTHNGDGYQEPPGKGNRIAAFMMEEVSLFIGSGGAQGCGSFAIRMRAAMSDG